MLTIEELSCLKGGIVADCSFFFCVQLSMIWVKRWRIRWTESSSYSLRLLKTRTVSFNNRRKNQQSDQASPRRHKKMSTAVRQSNHARDTPPFSFCALSTYCNFKIHQKILKKNSRRFLRTHLTKSSGQGFTPHSIQRTFNIPSCSVILLEHKSNHQTRKSVSHILSVPNLT